MPIPDLTGLFPIDLPIYGVRYEGGTTPIACHTAMRSYPEGFPSMQPRWKAGETATLTLPSAYICDSDPLRDAWGYATPLGIGLGAYAGDEPFPFATRLIFLRAADLFVRGLAAGEMSWFEWRRTGAV